jgi:transitional endoplasmic reticulum ATPase
MNEKRIRLSLIPLGDPGAFDTRCIFAGTDEPELTLRQLLTEQPALALAPVPPAVLDLRVARLNITIVDPGPDQPVYRPTGLSLAGRETIRPAPPGADTSVDPVEPDPAASQPATTRPASGGGAKPGTSHPPDLDDAPAVLLAHDGEISRAAGYLDSGLSVLVQCDKLLVEHLATEIAKRSGRTYNVIRPGATEVARGPAGLSAGRRQEMLNALQEAVRGAKEDQGRKVRGDVIVVPHLDLLAGGSDAALSAEARELTDVLYERSKVILLAFVDLSLTVPEVLANRFAVRLGIDLLPREIPTRDGIPVPVGRALVTAAEAELFADFNELTLYKHIAGMNAVRLRHAVRYAYHQHRAGTATFAQLLGELRAFKVATSSAFELPNVSFDDIGGYPGVKYELGRALRLIAGADALPEQLRHELVPRGFIFHGPPGTGKTLFAKAVASALDATIQVVSGPEVNDMYVGESERKVREIFAGARRNAPAVVVFDEFDSIAGKRTGREDGGSRAGNAIVAQLLTEMDGFRPEVPVLVIGTTNRLDIIDEALLRPSRFKPVQIDLPDDEARREIAGVHARHFGIEVSEDLLDHIARATYRMNGDEIRSVFRDARADELLSEPHQPADARRLGQLVGRLRRVAQERDLARSTTEPGHTSRPGSATERSPMVVISAGTNGPAAADVRQPDATTARAVVPTATPTEETLVP